MKATNCPSCGATIKFQSAVSLMLVCEYCDSRIIRKDLDLEAIGKMAQLNEDGSAVQLGTKGHYQGVNFETIGRIQLKYEYGYWNEWFLAFEDGRYGWMGETQGDYAISFQVPSDKVGSLPEQNALRAGMNLVIAGESFQVRDIQTAHCIGGEGELPFEVGSGYDVSSVDLAGTGNRFGTVDYSEDPPMVFTGENLDFDDLSLSDLKEIEGW